jgi:hypothetical protein
MRFSVASCALLALLLGGILGCKSGGEGYRPKWGFSNPFKSSEEIAADLPPKPSTQATPGPAGSAAGFASTTPGAGSTGSLAGTSSYPGATTSYENSTSAQQRAAAGSLLNAGSPVASADSKLTTPQRGLYSTTPPSAGKSPYDAMTNSAPSATNPFGSAPGAGYDRMASRTGAASGGLGYSSPAGAAGTSAYDQGIGAKSRPPIAGQYGPGAGGSLPNTNGSRPSYDTGSLYSGSGYSTPASPAAGSYGPGSTSGSGMPSSYLSPGGPAPSSTAAMAAAPSAAGIGPAAGTSGMAPSSSATYPSAGNTNLGVGANYTPGQTGYTPGQTAYAPGQSDYTPGNNGYNPPNTAPYSSPAGPYASAAGTYNGPAPYAGTNAYNTAGANVTQPAGAAAGDSRWRPGSTGDWTPPASAPAAVASPAATGIPPWQAPSASVPPAAGSYGNTYLR